MTLLASGKTGANKYDLKAVDATKILPDLDMRLLAETEQRMMEETLGWSPSGNLGASAAFDADLSIITKANIADYIKYRAQMIQTYVANNSFLAVNASSTANAITLEPAKISDIDSPNGTNYAKTTSLPFAYRDNLSFCFKAKDTSTSTVQIQITGLSGLVGAIDAVDEDGNTPSIVSGRYYRIVLTGTSGTKKAIVMGMLKATLSEAIAGTNNTKFLTPYLASNLPAFRIAKQTPQNLSNGVATKITGFTVDFDLGNYWSAIDSRYTPPAGTYQFNFVVNTTSGANYSYVASLYKNGVLTSYGQINFAPAAPLKNTASELISMNGTDYIEIYVTMSGVGTLTLNEVFFSIFKIR